MLWTLKRAQNFFSFWSKSTVSICSKWISSPTSIYNLHDNIVDRDLSILTSTLIYNSVGLSLIPDDSFSSILLYSCELRTSLVPSFIFLVAYAPENLLCSMKLFPSPLVKTFAYFTVLSNLEFIYVTLLYIPGSSPSVA